MFALDLASYHIEEFPSHGELPVWVFGHETELDSDGLIIIRGGEIFDETYGDRGIKAAISTTSHMTVLPESGSVSRVENGVSSPLATKVERPS